MLMDNKDSANQAEAAQALKDYILAFQNKKVEDLRQDASLPPNVDTLYDYLRLLGEKSWKAPAPELIRVSTSAPPAPDNSSDRERTVRKNP
jgi:hypothetical protein